jgi:hypothetical protein
MVHIENRKRLHFGVMKRAARSVALVIVYIVSSGLWSGGSLAQRTRTEFNSPVRQEAQRNRPEPSPSTPIALPVINPSSALGSALASCETGAEASELSLPGAKGEIKLDRCYRGRDQLVCQFNALMAEANSLLDNYRKIVDANYPEVRDVGGICSIKPDTLANDLQNATEFANRFKAVKAEYEARVNCANRIEQSLKDVTLTDMTQAQSLVKSMIDTVEGDVKGVSAIQGKLSGLAERIDSSQKAMAPLQKIHRAMCMTHQHVGAEDKPQ